MEKEKPIVYQLKYRDNMPREVSMFVDSEFFTNPLSQLFEDVNLKYVKNSNQKYETELVFVDENNYKDTYLSFVFVTETKFYVKESKKHPLPKNMNNIILGILGDRIKQVENYTHVRYSDLEKALTYAFTKETSVDKNWTEKNPTLGQSSVAALVVQDYKEGRIFHAKAILPDPRLSAQESLASHYWNKIGENEIDFAKAHFPLGTVIPTGTENRGSYTSTRLNLLSNPDTVRRYEILRERTKEFLDK